MLEDKPRTRKFFPTQVLDTQRRLASSRLWLLYHLLLLANISHETTNSHEITNSHTTSLNAKNTFLQRKKIIQFFPKNKTPLQTPNLDRQHIFENEKLEFLGFLHFYPVSHMPSTFCTNHTHLWWCFQYNNISKNLDWISKVLPSLIKEKLLFLRETIVNLNCNFWLFWGVHELWFKRLWIKKHWVTNYRVVSGLCCACRTW